MQARVKYLISIGALEQIESLMQRWENQFPHHRRVPIIGRSNVGKSSLINALVKKKIALTSKSPGQTRKINFFLLDKYKLIIADLPGYGFARKSKKEQGLWQKIIEKYLTTDKNIDFLLCLIDFRNAPSELDKQALSYFEQLGLDCKIILTKIDGLKNQKETKAREKEVIEQLTKMNYQNNSFWTSSKKNIGIKQVFEFIRNDR